MRLSIKCSSAVHVLLMIAMLPAQHKITSEFLAGSVGSNPVEIRKLLSSLKKAGIIDVARGPGGAALKRAPQDITLLDIYSAVDSASLDELIGMHTHPSEACPFGKNIADVLAEPYAKIGETIRCEMRAITVAQLCDRLRTLQPDIDRLLAGAQPADSPAS